MKTLILKGFVLLALAGCTAGSAGGLLTCKGDCGTLDSGKKFSAVARVCYHDGNEIVGSDVTFIEEDIIISQAHIFGFSPESPACCGSTCANQIRSDYTRFKGKMYVCDGSNYRSEQIIIAKILDLSVRSTGHPPGYDLALAHVDRNCDKCDQGRSIKIEPIPLANHLPAPNASATHVYVGDPQQYHKRRYAPHLLSRPMTGGPDTPCTRQAVKHDGVENPPMIFETSGSPVLITECGLDAVHGFHGNGWDEKGIMYEELQLVQTQKRWVQAEVTRWTGRTDLRDACALSGRRSFAATAPFDVPQNGCRAEKIEEETPTLMCEQ